MSDNKYLEEKMNELEVKLAFQEDLLDTLNEIVTKQSKDIQDLWDANRLLKQSINDTKSDVTESNQEPPPPHY